MSKVQKAILKARAARNSGTGNQINLDEARRSGEKKSIEAQRTAESDAARPPLYVKVNRGVLKEEGLLAPDSQIKQIADQYRIIKRPIIKLALGQAADVGQLYNVVMVSSPLSGDGKTFNAINIALSIANEKDISVVLVDADVAKPHVSRLFGLQQEKGFIDVLREGKTDLNAVCFETDIPNLSIIPAGQFYDYAAELLASELMAEAVRRLAMSDSRRLAIFDSPPILQTSESRVLASRMGQIVLVVCANKTPRAAVIAAVDSLDTGTPINLIFNQAGLIFGTDVYSAYGYGYGSS